MCEKTKIGVKEPSFFLFWIACCDECHITYEVKPPAFGDVLYVSLSCDISVRNHAVRCARTP